MVAACRLYALVSVLISLVPASSAVSSPCSALCNQQLAREALEQLYTALRYSNDGNWRSQTDFCLWPGVSCCVEASVQTDSGQPVCGAGCSAMPTAVSLADLGLNGSLRLAETWGHPLSCSLLSLDLGQNPLLEATIPDAFSQLTALTYLNMEKSGLQGSLPASLSALSQLTFLGLNENQLTGSIPDAAWAAGMASLQFLELSRNQLTGSCPAALLAQTRLRKLDVSHNRLRGSIPTSWGRNSSRQAGATSSLSWLDLSGNRLTGTFPPSLTKLSIDFLDLSGNSLHGPLPTLTTMPVSILRLGNNQLSGTLPALSTSLRELVLRGNRFNGVLPQGLSRMLSLHALVLAGNPLQGALPDSLGTLKELSLVDVRNTSLTSTAPLGAAGDALLPTWLAFDTKYPVLDTVESQLICPRILPRKAALPGNIPVQVLLPATYYRYWGCKCASGFLLQPCSSPPCNASACVAEVGCRLADQSWMQGSCRMGI
ncbi:hypothetical protein V8C86DRAFT_657058 [Haematococcus lacustris]